MSDEDDDIAQRKMQFLFALRSKGVTDARVLSAMEKIDRGPFIRGLFSQRAYEDMPLPIACGQTISQPSVVGLMTQALRIEPRDKILEVGTGSGYQAAILSQLARRIYTVDRHKRLVTGRAWQVPFYGGLLLVAALLRALVDLDQQRFFLWLGISALAFLGATIFWGLLVVPRLKESPPAGPAG